MLIIFFNRVCHLWQFTNLFLVIAEIFCQIRYSEQVWSWKDAEDKPVWHYLSIPFHIIQKLNKYFEPRNQLCLVAIDKYYHKIFLCLASFSRKFSLYNLECLLIEIMKIHASLTHITYIFASYVHVYSKCVWHIICIHKWILALNKSEYIDTKFWIRWCMENN